MNYYFMLSSKTILFLVNLVHKLHLLIKFGDSYFFELEKITMILFTIKRIFNTANHFLYIPNKVE